MTAQDLTLYWNGTAITGTVGSFTRSLVSVPVMGAPEITVPLFQLPQMDGAVATLDPRVDMRRFSALLLSQYSGGGSGYNTIERHMRQEWQTLQATFSPHLGAKEARFDRKDTSAADISRVVDAYIVHTPAFIQAFQGGSDYEPGARWDETLGWLIYPLEFLALAPHFRDRTATTGTIKVLSSPPSSLVLTNNGIDECGAKVHVSTVTTSGITQFTLANATTGDSLIAKKLSGSFAVNDAVDWMHTDPQDVEFTANVAVPNASAFLSLAIGSNTFDTTLGAGTGDITLTVSFFQKWLTT